MGALYGSSASMMDETTDYYELLGIEAGAPTNEIKAAFKRMALKYHPDVYNGPDAEERMRSLLTAYKTLTDPGKRKAYDLAHGISRRVLAEDEEEFGFFRAANGRGFTAWSGPLPTAPKAAESEEPPTPAPPAEPPSHVTESKVTVTFPRLEAGSGATIALGSSVYTLTAPQAARLREDGRLLGADLPQRLSTSAGTSAGRRCTCHRCGHSWTVPPDQRRTSTERCPKCSTPDWAEYLLLRCQECTAVFESQQVRRYDRVKIGERYYGDYHLCSPYELFPTCPNCQVAHWCAGEEMRLNGRKAAQRHTTGPLRATGSLRATGPLRQPTGPLPRVTSSVPRVGYSGPMPVYYPPRSGPLARRGTRIPKTLLTLIMGLVIAGMLLALYAIIIAAH